MNPYVYERAIEALIEKEASPEWAGCPINTYVPEMLALAQQLHRECNCWGELERIKGRMSNLLPSAWNSESNDNANYGFTLSEWAVLGTITGAFPIVVNPIEGDPYKGNELAKKLEAKLEHEVPAYWVPMLEECGDDMARLASYYISILYNGNGNTRAVTVRMVRYTWERVIGKLIARFKKKGRGEKDIPPDIFDLIDLYDIILYAAKRLVDMGDDDDIVTVV